MRQSLDDAKAELQERERAVLLNVQEREEAERRFEEEISELHMQKKILDGQLEDATRKLEQRAEENNSLRENMAESAESLKRSKEKLENKQRELEGELEDLRRSLEETRREKQRIEEDAGRSREELVHEKNTELEVKEQELEAVRETLARMEEKLQDEETRRHELDSRLEDRKSEIEQLSQNLENTKAELQEKEDHARAKAEEHETEESRLNEERLQLQERAEILDREVSTVREELERQKQENASLQQKIRDSLDEERQKRKVMEARQEELVDERDSLTNQLHEQEARLTGEISNLEEDLNNRTEMVADAMKRLDDEVALRTDLISTANERESNLKETNRNLEQKLAETQNKLEALRQQSIESVHVETEDASGEEEEVAELKAVIKNLTKEKQSIESRLAEKENEASDSREKEMSAERELEEARAEIAELSERYAKAVEAESHEKKVLQKELSRLRKRAGAQPSPAEAGERLRQARSVQTKKRAGKRDRTRLVVGAGMVALLGLFSVVSYMAGMYRAPDTGEPIAPGLPPPRQGVTQESSSSIEKGEAEPVGSAERMAPSEEIDVGTGPLGISAPEMAAEKEDYAFSWPDIEVEGVQIDYDNRLCTIVFEKGVFSGGTNFEDHAVVALQKTFQQIKPVLDRVSVVIEGHAVAPDRENGDRTVSNYGLGMERANAVMRLLRRQFDLPANSIFATSAGDTDPPFENGEIDRNQTVVVKLIARSR